MSMYIYIYACTEWGWTVSYNCVHALDVCNNAIYGRAWPTIAFASIATYIVISH